jgi:hypothetical protein
VIQRVLRAFIGYNFILDPACFPLAYRRWALGFRGLRTLPHCINKELYFYPEFLLSFRILIAFSDYMVHKCQTQGSIFLVDILPYLLAEDCNELVKPLSLFCPLSTDLIVESFFDVFLIVRFQGTFIEEFGAYFSQSF